MRNKNIKSLNKDIITVLLEFETKGKIRNTNVHHGVLHAFVSSEKGGIKISQLLFSAPLKACAETVSLISPQCHLCGQLFSYVVLSQWD